MSESNNGRVPIAQAIDALRKELEEAMASGVSHGLKFRASEVELEMTACITKSGEAGGGIKWWLIDASVKGSLGSELTQQVRLKLVPTGAGDEPVLLEGI